MIQHDPSRKLSKNPINYKAVRSGVIKNDFPTLNLFPKPLLTHLPNPIIKRGNNQMKLMRNCKNISSLRTVQFTSEYRITLYLTENWGHPSLITTSQIDVLGPDHLPIKIDSIIPRYSKYNSDLLPLLINHEFNKKAAENSWYENWVPGHPIILTLCLNTNTSPCFLRIWNAIFEPTAGVKKIKIYCGKFFIVESEVPIQFGVIVPLSNDHFSKYPIYQPSIHELDNSAICIKDKYGKFPLKQAKSITIQCIEPYGISPHDPDLIGINSAIFFDIDGNKIDYSEILQIFIGEGNAGISDISPYYHYHQPKIEEKTMLSGYRGSNGIMKIVYIFKKPIQISMMKIYNYDGELYGSEVGMKKIKVFYNESQIFIGSIKRGLNINVWSEIWFIDATLIQERISFDSTLHSTSAKFSLSNKFSQNEMPKNPITLDFEDD